MRRGFHSARCFVDDRKPGGGRDADQSLGPHPTVIRIAFPHRPPTLRDFFVIAGTGLDITPPGSIGALGLLYVAGRALGKVFGARWGARKLGLSQEMQRWLGLGLMAQAGLAIGLTSIVNRQLPEYAPIVTAIELSSAIVYEIAGPVSARFAIMGSGESHPHDATPIGVLD